MNRSADIVLTGIGVATVLLALAMGGGPLAYLAAAAGGVMTAVGIMRWRHRGR